MDYKRYKKYFLARTFGFRYAGIALVALGAVLCAVGFFTYRYSVLPFGIAALAAGGVIGWLPSAGRADDKEVEDAIKRKTENAVENALAETGIRTRIADNVPSVIVIGYKFDAKNPYIRRGGDEHWRTSDCVCTVLIFAKTGVCAVMDTFSLVEDSVCHEVYQLSYSDFDSARFETQTHEIAYKNGTETAKFSVLVFALGKNEVLTVPAERTAAVEMAIDEALRRKNTVSGK